MGMANDTWTKMKTTSLSHMQIAYPSIHNDIFCSTIHTPMEWQNEYTIQVNVFFSHCAKCSSLKWAWAGMYEGGMRARYAWHVCVPIVFADAIWFAIWFSCNFSFLFWKINCSFNLPDVLKAFRGNINWGNGAN